ncbi:MULTISPECIES: MFS transporter [Actinosynnema]|uniref:MFS transporter n=1 Tax=Actinosynnema TaxID=40566 RepID=UPI0020A613C6|nr:MFS transporter [Actinosynnema pretiosum]MCP2096390.1 MFS-type transporter involved in bile tolerance, Atg22 family [Actinosynnema pretiosum]
MTTRSVALLDESPQAPAESPSVARAVFDSAGPSFFPLALVARFPYAMTVVGVLTLVVAARGSISLGGVTSATAGVGMALFGPLIGAAADRWGQRRVLLATGVATSAALTALVLLAYSPLPSAALLVAAFLVGATTPQVPPMSRSRLVGLVTRRTSGATRPKAVNAAMAYESAADEMTFVFGPTLVGVLAAAFSPAAPIIAAAALTLVAVCLFALHPSATAAQPTAEDRVTPDPVSALFRPSLLVVLLGIVGIGLFFGSVLTSLTSFMSDHGDAEQAGLVYGAMGLGSAVCALLAGMLPPAFALRDRWLAFAALALAGAVGLNLATSVPTVAIALALAGTGIGPLLVTLYTLVSDLAPVGRNATVMTMASTAIVVGQAPASTLTGFLAEDHGTTTALVMPLVAVAVIASAGLLNRFSSARTTPHA